MTRALWLVAFVLQGSAAFGQWTPPVGIPTPPFGITQVAPAPTLYVNEAVGWDSNPGTAASPRRTIPTTLPAGTVVQITGTQSTAYTSPNGLTVNGTAAAPVFLEGGTFTGPLEISGSYLIVDKAVSQAGWSSGASYVAFRDVEMTGGGLALVDWLGPSPNHIVLLRGNLHDIGTAPSTWPTGGDADSHGVGVGKNASYVWILNSTFTRVSGDGMQVNGEANGPQTHHIYFAGNTCVQNRQSCGWAKESADVVMSSNTCSQMRGVDGINPGNCFGAQYQATRVVFLKNDSSDSDYGIRIASDTEGPFDVAILANTFHNLHNAGHDPRNPQSPGAAIVTVNNGLRIVAQNTITDVDTGLGVANSGGMVVVAGNAFSATATAIDYETPTPTFSGNTFDVTPPVVWVQDAPGTLPMQVPVDLSSLATGYQMIHGVPLGIDLGTPPPVPPPPPKPMCPHTFLGLLTLLAGRCTW